MHKMAIVAKVMEFLSFIRAARWRRPSESPEAADCAVIEFDMELDAAKVAMMGIVTSVLRRFDPRVDTDHPIFRYLGERQVQGKPSYITLTLTIRRTEDAGDRNLSLDASASTNEAIL